MLEMEDSCHTTDEYVLVYMMKIIFRVLDYIYIVGSSPRAYVRLHFVFITTTTSIYQRLLYV